MTVPKREPLMPIPDPRGGLDRRQALMLLGAGLLTPSELLASELDPARFSGFVDGERQSFTLSNGTVLTHDGLVLLNAGIRVEGGRIVEVGRGVTGGEDLGGDWLVPGLVDAGCTLGMYEIGGEPSTRDDGDGPAVTVAARAVDGLNPRSQTLAVARAEGITHALLHPSLGRLVPGQAGLIRTAGGTLDSTVRRESVALVVCFGASAKGGEGGPSSRIGISRALLELMEGAPEPQALSARGRSGAGGTWRENSRSTSPPDTEHDRVLQQVRARSLKVIAAADRADDIERALDFFDAHQLDGLIMGGAEAWMVASQVADAGCGVLLGPLTTQPDSFDHIHARYENAAMLHDAGVPLALRSGGNHSSRRLRLQAGLLTAHGLPHEAAIHALTAGAGALLGVPGLGRLDPGTAATFFRATGDPLQPRSQVVQVWMAGRRADMRTRQTELRDRFETLSPR